MRVDVLEPLLALGVLTQREEEGPRGVNWLRVHIKSRV